MYVWSRNLPDPKRLLLIRLLALDLDESDDTEVILCKAVGVVLEECSESLVGDAEDIRDPRSSLSVLESDGSLLASLSWGIFVRLDLACSRPKASRIISSSSSVTWLRESRARCSANFDFKSSRAMGIPEDARKRLKRRVRLHRASNDDHPNGR